MCWVGDDNKISKGDKNNSSKGSECSYYVPVLYLFQLIESLDLPYEFKYD